MISCSDEFEKAHHDISSLLLQVLDEGSLTDAQGHRVDFRNTLIVLTSNLGANILIEPDLVTKDLQEADGDISLAKKKAVMDVVTSSFAPEFLNRLDEFIIFHRLSKSALRDIVDVRISELQRRLLDRKISLQVDNEVKDWLADHGYDPRYGARPLNRLVTTQLGNRLAYQIIRGRICSGHEAQVFVQESGEGLEITSSASTMGKE